MSEAEREEVERSAARIYGVPVAWIILYGALIGATSLIPLFPYIGGGGYLPLCVAFGAMAPLILGPAGIISATIGGLIGMFISPAAFPLGLLDVLLTGILPAVFVTLTVNNHRLWWKATVPIFLAMGVWEELFPYYYPGPAAGFENPPQPLYGALSAYYWLPWLIIMGTPLGIKYVPKWIRSTGRMRYVGVFLAMLSGIMVWSIPWFLPYWYIYSYPVALAVSVLIGYSWWFPVLSIVITIITLPIIEALRRSGLPPAPGAIW